MTLEFDHVVLGGGCIGSTILSTIAKRGFQRLALVDHGAKTTSATANSGGLLRVFHESPDHVELALAHWGRMQTGIEEGLLTTPFIRGGHLYFFHPDRYPGYEKNLRRMNEAGVPFEVLTSVRGRDRFPEFNWTAEQWAIYEPMAGQMNPQEFSQAQKAEAIAFGANVFENEEVKRIFLYRDRYHLQTDGNLFVASSLILAGGSAMLPRLRDLGVDLPLQVRQLKVYTGQKVDPTAAAPNYLDRETLEFGILNPGPDLTLSTPQALNLRETWGHRFTEKSADDVYSPERAGILGFIPGHPRLAIATGWGGTAFKFSYGVGHRLADLIESNLQNRRALYASL